MKHTKKRLKIWKGWSEAVNQERTDNTIAKRKRTKWWKTLYLTDSTWYYTCSITEIQTHFFYYLCFSSSKFVYSLLLASYFLLKQVNLINLVEYFLSSMFKWCNGGYLTNRYKSINLHGGLTYHWNLQFLHIVIINKTKVLLPQA